jgi:hypothetical protein
LIARCSDGFLVGRNRLEHLEDIYDEYRKRFPDAADPVILIPGLGLRGGAEVIRQAVREGKKIVFTNTTPGEGEQIGKFEYTLEDDE